MYCAMIGDLINSKKLLAEDRAAIQERLKALLNGVNENFSSFLVSPFLMTLGDEFQGVLTAAKPALEIIEFLGQNLLEFPIQIRYGIGIGELSTNINREQALGDDGPAYHYARQGIEHLKKDGWAGFPVSIQTENDDCGLLYCYCQLLNEMAETWSASQRNCILNMEIMKEQLLVAHQLNISPSSVSRSLQRGHYTVYCESKEALGQYLLNVYDCPKSAGRIGKYNRAAILRQSHRSADALGTLRELLQTASDTDAPPSRSDIVYLLSECHLDLLQYKEAAGLVEAFLASAKASSLPHVTAARLRNQLGHAYLGLSKNATDAHDSQAAKRYADQAVAVLTEALRGTGDDLFLHAQAKGNLASALGKQSGVSREIESRLELEKELCTASPLFSDARIANLHNLAAAYYTTDELDKALEEIQLALKLAQAHPSLEMPIESLYNLYALLLSRTGAATEEIVQQFEKAISYARQRNDDQYLIAICQNLRAVCDKIHDVGAAASYMPLLHQAERRLERSRRSSRARGEEG